MLSFILIVGLRCSYCEAPVGEFVNPGDFDLLHQKHGGSKLGHILNKSSSSSSSSSSDDGSAGRDADTAVQHNADGTIEYKKKPGLLQRIIHH